GYNFDIRKHVLEYDDVVNKQREIIYNERYEVLTAENLREQIEGMLHDEISHLVQTFVPEDETEEPDFLNLYNAVRTVVPLPPEIQPSKWEHLDPDERAIVIEEQLQDLVTRLYDEREQAWGPEVMRQVERQLMLDVVDQLWVRHLTALDALRDGIG